jgi:hypothetical protein
MSAEDRLSAASEKLLADFDRTPDAIDHDELAARLWLIEQQARAALRALPSEQTAGGDGLREARDRMVDEVREGTRTLADAHWPDVATADRMRKAIDRIHLAVAAFANEMDAPASPPVERVATKPCEECGALAGEYHGDICSRRAPAAGDGEARNRMHAICFDREPYETRCAFGDPTCPRSGERQDCRIHERCYDAACQGARRAPAAGDGERS